ncbi:hypothetical protein L202_03507 [Cryptococcus amylolentus CBS 6039]|uniref:STB6-like N-terminal domain-containing protein n=1 Tax=Cryptococcus amylolentus CBS 6039 TaxID=1295533 RepID=A0A1E3HTA1_9TREE|nr:hypothetical protein L202_03507 [Cryptococcus amylolentus CBS 6039]ODN79552.1 hypothetical protein L202_03507 [Cryptococcus amylolentus CBS 6039]
MSHALSPPALSQASHNLSTVTPYPSPSPFSPISPAETRQQQPQANSLLVPTDREIDELETKWLPNLGRLRVEREVVLKGYALYSLRNWFLSRSHFSHTIVTQTGKPSEQITAYLLVPSLELSEQEGAREIANAIEVLTAETRSQPRKTELGTLLVTTPSAFGQDINPVPGGDFRIAKPYIIVNTGLRRLGCGGRAILGLESPIPALRRKFHDLYRIPTLSPQPTQATASSPTRSMSISGSPQRHRQLASPTIPNGDGPAHDAISSDPFMYLIVELVKVIQAALALWGMFEDVGEDAHGRVVGPGMEIDGLFCDETKGAIFRWRRSMGMEHEESLKIEKETSGGCIDPKTLTALLSSITSLHYQLEVLDVERLPKDPFTSIRRTLKTWLSFQTMMKSPLPSPFLTVPSVRALFQHYLLDRRHTGDSLRVQRLLSEVAHTASSLSANLKGVGEDPSLRRREHHLRHRMDEQDLWDPGVLMIVPEGDVGSVAPPDVITSDLEAYVKGVLRSREKDWDVMGARRLAELWNGTFGASVEGRKRRRGSMSMGLAGGRERHVLRKRTTSRDDTIREEEGDLRGTFKELSGRAGQALRDGLGIMSRKGHAYETSDSETGAGPGPSTLRASLLKKKQSVVPVLIEPGVVDNDAHPDLQSTSPSPSKSHRHLNAPGVNFPTFPSFLNTASRANSRAPSARPPTINIPSGNESDVWSRADYNQGRSPGEERSDLDWGQAGGNKRASFVSSSGANAAGAGTSQVSDRAVAWRNKGRSTVMLRSSSDGADVVLDDSGMEWEVMNPRGTGKRGDGDLFASTMRRHSFDNLEEFEGVRMLSAQHLQVDVEMCSVVLELRLKERILSQKVKDAKMLEKALFTGATQFVESANARRRQVDALMAQSAALVSSLRSLETDEDPEEELPYDRFHYYLSEETHRPELLDDLGRLKEMWEQVRKEGEDRRKSVEQEGHRRGWWFW